jgi:hypothetical protein
MASRAVVEGWLSDGNKTWRKLGSGCEPRTLSTTIFKGSGVSRTRGVESKLSVKIPRI